jgi:hypothetical protein
MIKIRVRKQARAEAPPGARKDSSSFGSGFAGCCSKVRPAGLALSVLVLGCTVLGTVGCDRASSAVPGQVQGQSRSASPPAKTAMPSAADSPNTPAVASRTKSAAAGHTGRTAPATTIRTGGQARSRIVLAPSRLAAYTAESWTAEAAGPVRNVAGHDIELNECASIDGASTWQQQPYASSGGNSAILETYTFSSANSALSAFTKALSGMHDCQATSRALQIASHITGNAVVRQTASSENAAAFERIWTGVQGISAAGPQTNHLYLAVRGTSVLILHFDELPGSKAKPYDVRSDPSVLAMLAGLLVTSQPSG